MRITDQYFWNVVFIIFFLILVFMGVVILDGEAYKTIADLTFVDFALMSLASFRLIRFMMYDRVTAFFREQFYDLSVTKTKATLEKPAHGPRRTLVELLSCPWCFGIWATATVTFFYLLTPYALYPVLILAISAVASLLQVTANMIGWKAEQLKSEIENV